MICPRCGSDKVTIKNGIINCDTCQLKEELIDFNCSPTWEDYYKDYYSVGRECEK